MFGLRSTFKATLTLLEPSCVGLYATAIRTSPSGPIVPEGGSNVTSREFTPYVAETKFSKENLNGTLSWFTSVTDSLRVAPTRHLPKLTHAVSSVTRGSVTAPASRKGTETPTEGARNVNARSCASPSAGAYSNAISYRFPGATTPRGVRHRNGE